MRRISLNSIKGYEKLAKAIITDSDMVLMSEGTVIKQSYVPRLEELGIEYVYVEDELSKGIKVDEIIEEQIKKKCQHTIKKTFDKFFYSGTSELEKLGEIAEIIILDMVQQPEVMFNISGIRERSEKVYSHSVNVCALSVLIALKMKLPKNKIKQIAVGSLLLDIGFNYVPVNVNNRSYDSFTEEEMREIRKHVVHGYSAVEKEDWLSSVAKDIILSHHECIDGSGYPFHLKADRIKIGSKIASVCDAFDSMVYGNFVPKVKVHEAINYILSQGGRKYDFDVVQIFNESVAAYPNGSMIITSEGEIAIVLRQNNKCPTRPVIRLIIDKDGNNYTDWIIKDLTQDLTLFIDDTIES